MKTEKELGGACRKIWGNSEVRTAFWLGNMKEMQLLMEEQH
jgi:hypothetical protein